MLTLTLVGCVLVGYAAVWAGLEVLAALTHTR